MTIVHRPLGTLNNQPEIVRGIRDLEQELRLIVAALNELLDTVPTQYIITVSNDNPSAGSTINVSAQLATDSGNAVGEAGRVVTWSSTNGGSFSAPTSVTNGDGIATVDFTVATLAGLEQLVSAEDTQTVEGNSGTITIIPGVAAKLVMLTQPPLTARDGAVLSRQPVVGIADAYDNLTDDDGIVVTATPSAGVVRGSNGIASLDGDSVFTTLLLDDA